MPTENNIIEDYLTEWAQTVTDQIRQNLVNKDKWFDQSTLAQSIVALPVEQVSGGYLIKIEMNDYGKFVDEGRGKGSVGREGMLRLQEWVSRRGIPTPLHIKVAVKTKRGIKMYNRNFKNTIESRNAIAWGAAMNIKKRGYVSKGKGFYSEIVNDDLLNELSASLGSKYGEIFEAEIVSL